MQLKLYRCKVCNKDYADIDKMLAFDCNELYYLITPYSREDAKIHICFNCAVAISIAADYHIHGELMSEIAKSLLMQDKKLDSMASGHFDSAPMEDEDILKLEVEFNNPPIPLKEYLKLLLKTLWIEGEGFSGKRPLGDSGWQYDIAHTLVKHKVIKGNIDENEINGIDWKEINELILRLIDSL